MVAPGLGVKSAGPVTASTVKLNTVAGSAEPVIANTVELNTVAKSAEQAGVYTTTQGISANSVAPATANMADK